jgi:hypothetical protein
LQLALQGGQAGTGAGKVEGVVKFIGTSKEEGAFKLESEIEGKVESKVESEVESEVEGDIESEIVSGFEGKVKLASTSKNAAEGRSEGELEIARAGFEVVNDRSGVKREGDLEVEVESQPKSRGRVWRQVGRLPRSRLL